MKKIKLMQITHDLAIGGLQQVVVNLCRSIDRDIFDVSVLCLRRQGEFVSDVRESGVEIFSLPFQENRTDYFSFVKVAKILRDEHIEIIHTHNTQPFIDGTLASFFSGVKRRVHTDHARNFPDKRRYMLAEHIMSYFAYRVVGVSEHTSANLISYEKIAPEKIRTIENGIDGSRYNIEVNVSDKKKELGVGIQSPVIGLGVRLCEQKGISFLLQAMPEVIAAVPDIQLLIAGQGHLDQSLQQEAIDLGIKQHVKFLGPRLDIASLLHVFDIYVLPSLWEGLPMVLLEAMAAGCPVIATKVGGVTRAVQHESNGLLVPAEDSDALAQAIVRLLADGALREKFSRNGLLKFEQQFSAEVMARKYESLYLGRDV